MPWAQRLSQAWLRRGVLAMALWPLAQLYRGLWALRSALYRLGWRRSTRLPVPVVVVGNVIVGGAGKTPTVVAVVQHLRQRGWTPGIVSRGHGRNGSSPLLVQAHTPAALAGDEPVLLARLTQAPVVVGRQRVAAAHRLLAQHPQVDIVVSDDGMQHWALQRDLTLVVFDERGTGNGWLLPAGLLREPWPAPTWGPGPQLVLQYGRHGHTTHTTHTTHTQPLPTVAPVVYPGHKRLATHATNSAGLVCPLREWLAPTLPTSRQAFCVGALAGIATPNAFFDSLQALGLPLQATLSLPDHASADALLQAVLAHAAQHPGIDVWLCTEKDAVKLFADPRCPPHIWAVGLEAQLPDALYAAIDDALA